ncbi:VOC family protein [Luteolibacter sp. LG18]|nr:VOC family protein [Luteolibacter sp. LG18]
MNPVSKPTLIRRPMKTKITPFLWFDTQAEEAANFYVGIFPNSKITAVVRYPDTGKEHHGKEPGSVMVVSFELDGQALSALNGGPMFQFSCAVSFAVECETQEEIDYYWEKLGADGDPSAQQCGWLADKFGLSWQIVPKILPELLADTGSPGALRAMAALMEMRKLDIAALKKAHAG